MPSKKEHKNRPPATRATYTSATQSNYSQKDQDMMILILKNYNDALRKPSSIAPDANLFNSNTINDQIMSWNNNKNFIYRDDTRFHKIFREKLQEHLQEIQKTTPQDYKDAKFNVLLDAIQSTENRQDSDSSYTEIKKVLASLITEAKYGNNITTITYR